MSRTETTPQAVAAQPVLDIRHLSTEQLQALGVSHVAYVKAVMLEGGIPGFAIHAADGTPMALAQDCAVAVAAIEQHEMIAAMVH